MPPKLDIFAIVFFVAFAVSMAVAPGAIAALRRRRLGQSISTDGPESHHSKEGTPTMGGIIILAGALAGSLVALWLFTRGTAFGQTAVPGLNSLLAVLLLVVAFAGVGMLDDYLTIHPRGGVRGISSKPKAAVQALLAIAFLAWVAQYGPEGFAPVLFVGERVLLQGAAYWVFAALLIVGMANFVNICDGLDGLVAGLVVIAAGAVSLAAVFLPSLLWEQSGGLLFCVVAAVAGGCLAFLWFNANPAKVFMGDTGALAIGVALPAVAVVTHCEVFVIIAGMVFILDGLSSALQWAVFKFTRVTSGTGRRVFKKSPIHHHFELSGWPEQKLVVRFWVVGLLFAVAAVLGAAHRIW